MHNEDCQQGSPVTNMDINSKTRGLQLTTNNGELRKSADAGRAKRHRGGHPRECSSLAQPPASAANCDLRTKSNKGRRYHQQRQRATTEELPGASNYTKAPSVRLDDEFEVGSVFNAGSKKQNINHLLNFQFEPRSHKHAPKFRNSSDSSKKPKYNKEQFLQANCQFVVTSSGDYSVHLADPDIPVNWSLIEQVVLKTTASVPSCPICLYPPKAAKISRCGHVFCWPCILHYLALSDEKWRKCPICFEAIHKADLKSVISNAWQEFQVNDTIELSLMRRERNSLFALPVEKYYKAIDEKHPGLSDKLTSHSNLVVASPAQVSSLILSRERFELEEKYRDEKDEPEACFIEEALQYLSQREAGFIQENPQESKIVEEDSASSSSVSSETEDVASAFPADFKEEEEEARPRQMSSSSDETVELTEDIIVDEVTAEDLQIERKGGKNSSPKETFYFYQASDGQPIFLHALNVQMLIAEYGSLEQCPHKITGKILEKDYTSMNELMRNKLRYLRHLPLTSIFEVCEIQLKAPLVSKETCAEFAPQIEARRRKRNRRAREERRREKWIQVEENKRIMGKFPDLKCKLESAFHFPQFGAAEAQSNESLEQMSAASSLDSDGAFSFAKMLKEGVARPSAIPPPPPPGASMKAIVKNEDSEPEPEGYVPPPPKANLGDALAHAFAVQASISAPTAAGPKPKKGKKMKGQKISLTGPARPMMD